MRKLASMSEEDLREYLRLVGEATRSVVPPDGSFVVVIFGEDGTAHYVSSTDRKTVPQALRELAGALERDMASKN